MPRPVTHLPEPPTLPTCRSHLPYRPAGARQAWETKQKNKERKPTAATAKATATTAAAALPLLLLLQVRSELTSTPIT